MSEVLAYFTKQRDRHVDLLRQLVELESPTAEKPAVDRICEFMAEQYRSLGLAVERIRQTRHGDFVRAVWDPGQSDADAQVLVLMHLDTVWPIGSLAERPFRVENGKAYGPGIFDMKAGVMYSLAAIEGLQALGRRPRRRVVFLCTTEEEIGSPASRAVIEAEARKSKAALVMEPGVDRDGALKTSRKGVGMFELTIAGKPSHAGGDPQAGASAVQELAHQILALHELNDFDQGTTVNVGVVSGGTARNVVAATAEAQIDLRVPSMAEAERVVRLILKRKPVTKGTAVTVSGGLNRPPMERTGQIAAMFKHAHELGAEFGLKLRETGTGGGSDGNFTAAVGCPTLDGLGGVGGGAHAFDEHVWIDALPARIALLARLLETV